MLSHSRENLAVVPYQPLPSTEEFIRSVAESQGTKKTATVFFEKLETFVRENYEIIGSSPSQKPLKEILADPLLILGLGEQHSLSAMHQRLNAALVNELWDSHSQLFVEGGEEDLAYYKEMGGGMLQHLQPAIIEQAQTWDHNTAQGFENSELAISFTQILLSVFQKSYQLCSSQELSKEKFLKFLHESLDKEMQENLLNKIRIQAPLNSCIKNESESIQKVLKESGEEADSLDFLFAERNSKVENELYQSFIKHGVLSLIREVIDQAPMFSEEWNQWEDTRNCDLQAHVIEALSAKNKGFVLAGSLHIAKLHQFLSKEQAAQKAIYLCLKPRKDISEQSVQRSLSLLSEKMEHQVEFAPMMKVQKSVQVAFEQSDMEARLRRLLTLDFEDIDFGDHHFGVVLGDIFDCCCEELMKLEQARMKLGVVDSN